MHPRMRFFVYLIFWTMILSFRSSHAATYTELSYADLQNAAETTVPVTTTTDKNFILMQTELGRYEIAAQKPWIPLPDGKYRLGHKAERIALLRERLEATGDLAPDDEADNALFDDAMKDAVINFQNRHGLSADGIVGKATLAELNITPEQRIKSIQINMQRWADLTKQLGDRFILVNIPDYQLHLFENGKEVLTMKAVVGKPDWQTPELTSRITRIVLNPYWHVPDKIAAKDLAPKVMEDPYYLDDMHIKVYVRNSGHSEQISSQDIDWANVSTDDAAYDFRQEPGDNNALGLVKFEFPNRFAVYLHDTPAKSVFDLPLRDLSHGCVRLEKPFDLLSYLMKDDPEWDTERVNEVVSTHKTTYVTLKKPIPIYITYLTVWIDDNGVVNYRNDIYNRDI